jgi:uncharacterized caspase-like protein
MRAIMALLIWLLPSAAFAQARIALLIGNQAYDASVGVLKNSYNDIAVVGEALRAQSFELLPPIKDASRSAILGGVRELVRRLNEAGADSIGFVYYSGHGAAEKGTNINYLIPVNAKQPGTDAFWDDSLKLEDVLRLLDGARSAAKFVIFDACRNELQLPTKATSKGLVPVAEQEGLFVAYASSPGRTATDRGDKSGVYAAALAAELLRPGLDHLNLFQNVKEAVLASTNGVQQPWESNGLSRRVYLTGQPKLDPALVPRVSEATEVWDRTKDTKEIAVLEAFAVRYKDTIYAELARARIEALQRKRTPQRPSQLGAVEPPTTQVRISEAAEAWDRAKDTTDAAVLEAFIARFKETFYADLARARLDELRKQRVAAATPTQSTKGLFDGSWRAKAISNCPNLQKWENRFKITGSKIQGETYNGKISGRVAADGSFRYTVPGYMHPNILGAFTGKLHNDTGTGTLKYPACTGSITLNRM